MDQRLRNVKKQNENKEIPVPKTVLIVTCARCNGPLASR